MKFTLHPGKLLFEDFRTLLDEKTTLVLSSDCIEAIHASEKIIQKAIVEKKPIYGVNTGFGALANATIDSIDLEALQRKIVLSHAAGIGELLSDNIVRLIIALKINSLARGFSGVRLLTIEALIKLFNARIYPCIPSQGSVGASGDLAPLAHMSALLLGIGEARHEGKLMPAQDALKKINMEPLQLGAKEGLALLNGTQVSTALAIVGFLAAEDVFFSAITAGALSVDAMKGSCTPFDERIQLVRGHPAQIKVAAMLRELLDGSEILESHLFCERVQDPYSLRCQPQVMGACLAQMQYASHILLTEANGVSDNPLIFSEQEEILSGGNFHAEPVAFAADALAICLAEIGALSERRIALLVDSRFSGLPPFLVDQPGLNSGFMLAQVTAAALASENKSLAHPASVDSLPTSANQEDHVSMATYAARRLGLMAENSAGIIAIELLAACQGIDFNKPLKTSPMLQKIHQLVREQVSFYEEDRFFAPDIAKAKNLVQSGKIREHAILL